MLNYYDILGISRSATPIAIKTAFKKLAIKYHPDKNAGDFRAEEKFKKINEAYQILSDPEKKRRYDFVLNYSYQTLNANPQAATNRPPTPRKERSVYDRYGKYDWRKAPKYKKAPIYKIDRNYYRNQLLTFLATFILIAIILGASNYYNYLEEQKELKIKQQNDLVIQRAQTLYAQQNFREAINLVLDLAKRFPIESEYYMEKEQMVAGLNKMAISEFSQASYYDAIDHLEIVRDYERPMRLKTWQMLADSYYSIGEYRKAIHALDYIFMRDKYNLALAIRIGEIYYENLNMADKAMEYYDEAKLLFKEFQRSSYGDAFELVVPPDQLPEHYYDMFYKRIKLNYELERYDQMINDCNWAIFLKRDNGELYHIRGIAKMKAGYQQRACKDWQRAINYGYSESRSMINLHCGNKM